MVANCQGKTSQFHPPPQNHKHFYEKKPFLEKIKNESEKHISQEYLISFLHASQLFPRSKKFPVIFVMQIPYFKMPVLQSKWNVHPSVPISYFPAIRKTKFSDSAPNEDFCPQMPHCNLYMSLNTFWELLIQYNLRLLSTLQPLVWGWFVCRGNKDRRHSANLFKLFASDFLDSSGKAVGASCIPCEESMAQPDPE